MRILIAEDDLTSRGVLAAVVVKTVDEAAAWGAPRRPDAPRLVILDWIGNAPPPSPDTPADAKEVPVQSGGREESSHA